MSDNYQSKKTMWFPSNGAGVALASREVLGTRQTTLHEDSSDNLLQLLLNTFLTESINRGFSIDSKILGSF